jgi:hypothetical protein
MALTVAASALSKTVLPEAESYCLVKALSQPQQVGCYLDIALSHVQRLTSAGSGGRVISYAEERAIAAARRWYGKVERKVSHIRLFQPNVVNQADMTHNLISDSDAMEKAVSLSAESELELKARFGAATSPLLRAYPPSTLALASPLAFAFAFALAHPPRSSGTSSAMRFLPSCMRAAGQRRASPYTAPLSTSATSLHSSRVRALHSLFAGSPILPAFRATRP